MTSAEKDLAFAYLTGCAVGWSLMILWRFVRSSMVMPPAVWWHDRKRGHQMYLFNYSVKFNPHLRHVVPCWECHGCKRRWWV